MDSKTFLQKVSYAHVFGAIRGLSLYFKCDTVRSFPILIGNTCIANRGSFEVGRKLMINSKPLPVSITVNENANLTIGDNVFINYGASIGCTHAILIGNDVMIGDLSLITDSNYHLCDIHDNREPRSVCISDNVWIARQCTILPGVTIGTNSVIATGSIVTRDIPDNVLAAGVPARVIRPIEVPDGWIRREH